MSKSQKWMPVFVVVPATTELIVSDADEPYVAEPKVSRCEDFWQRIGTAYLREDGGWAIHLTAIPIDGKLIIRPPKADERLDPTISSQ